MWVKLQHAGSPHEDIVGQQLPGRPPECPAGLRPELEAGAGCSTLLSAGCSWIWDMNNGAAGGGGRCAAGGKLVEHAFQACSSFHRPFSCSSAYLSLATMQLAIQQTLAQVGRLA